MFSSKGIVERGDNVEDELQRGENEQNRVRVLKKRMDHKVFTMLSPIHQALCGLNSCSPFVWCWTLTISLMQTHFSSLCPLFLFD